MKPVKNLHEKEQSETLFWQKLERFKDFEKTADLLS